ncbi:MAG: thioredoxin domain-containing protein [Gemmatimonadales bacterium]|nr:thioredoxin domain-containing protein [Gemmatimonadales bacterium]
MLDKTIAPRPKWVVALSFGAALVVGFVLGSAFRRGSAGGERPTAAVATAEPGAPEGGMSATSETPGPAGQLSADRAEGPEDLSGDGRPFRGPADAPVTVVEFTDYECAFCRRHHRNTYPLIVAAYEGKVKYVVRNYPVKGLHPRAMQAAQAAECAALQGKFWEYQDLLLQRGLSRESLDAHAREVGLDLVRFTSCLDSEKTAALVEQDLEEGRRRGIPGTPAFFINGRPLFGAQPVEVFQAVIDSMLAAASNE